MYLEIEYKNIQLFHELILLSLDEQITIIIKENKRGLKPVKYVICDGKVKIFL